MNPIGLLLVTHAPLGTAMLATAQAILGRCPMPVEVLEVPLDADPELTTAEAMRLATHLDRGGGVLVLTDLYGSTPGNIACRLLEWEQVRVVTGLSLPMLFRVFNYAQLDLDALADKAASGGRDGVLLCCRKPSDHA